MPRGVTITIALALSAVVAVWLATRRTEPIARASAPGPANAASREPGPRPAALAAADGVHRERPARHETVAETAAPDPAPGAVICGQVEPASRYVDVIVFSVGEGAVPSAPAVRGRVDPSGAFEVQLDAPRAGWLFVDSMLTRSPVTRRIDFGSANRVDVGRIVLGEQLVVTGRLTVDGSPISAGMMFARLSEEGQDVERSALPGGPNVRDREVTWVRGAGFVEPSGGAALDPDGRFEISGLGAALYSLECAGMRPDERVVVRPPASGVDIRLVREPFVLVVRLAGRPVAGARVRFDGSAGVTAGDGRAELTTRPGARGAIVVEATGLPQTTAARDPSRGSRDAPQVVDLEPGSTQPGRLVALFDDTAFSGAVRVELLGRVEGEAWSLRVDVPVVEGAFTLEALPVGKFEMWVQPGARAAGAAQCLVAQRRFVTTASGVDTTVEFEASLGGWVEIEVEGSWWVRTALWRDAAGFRPDLPTLLVTLDLAPEHRRYGFQNPLPPGTYELEMSDGRRAWTSPVTVEARRTTVLKANPRRIDDRR